MRTNLSWTKFWEFRPANLWSVLITLIRYGFLHLEYFKHIAVTEQTLDSNFTTDFGVRNYKCYSLDRPNDDVYGKRQDEISFLPKHRET